MQGIAQVGKGGGIIWVEGGRRPQMRERLFRLALIAQAQTEQIVSLDQIRIIAQGFAPVVHGALDLAAPVHSVGHDQRGLGQGLLTLLGRQPASLAEHRRTRQRQADQPQPSQAKHPSGDRPRSSQIHSAALFFSHHSGPAVYSAGFSQSSSLAARPQTRPSADIYAAGSGL